MFNCRAAHFGGLRHMTPDKSDSHGRPEGQTPQRALSPLTRGGLKVSATLARRRKRDL